MTPADDESLNDVMSVSMSIHIPWDILNEHSPYKCPTAVNIELSPRSSPGGSRRRLSNSTKGQGQIAKASDRWVATGSKEPTASASSCLSRKGLSTLKSIVMEKMDDSVDSSGQNTFQDVIEMVAAANEHVTDYTNPSELPELRTSPCQFHCRQNQPANLSPILKQRHHYLYSSNFHAGGGCSPRSTVSKRSGSGDQNKDTVETRILMEKSRMPQQDVQGGHCHTFSRPALPQSMTSKEFIKSWLQHGSQPSGQSHFPEVIAPSKPANPSNNTPLPPGHHSHNNNYNYNLHNNNNNRQILAPISQTIKHKRQKK